MGPQDDAIAPRASRGFTVKIPVKVAPMARTAPWSAPVKTMWTAHRLMELVSAKKAGEDRTAPSPAPKEPGVQDAMPRVTVPTEQNATLQMDPAPARLAGRGRAVTNRARWARLGLAA